MAEVDRGLSRATDYHCPTGTTQDWGNPNHSNDFQNGSYLEPNQYKGEQKGPVCVPL